MSSLPPFEAAEWSLFTVPHAIRLAGEHQHLLGTGSIVVATTLRLTAEVEEVPGEFSLAFTGGERGDDAGPPPDDEAIADFAVRWEDALGRVAVGDPELLHGLGIYVDFGRLWDVCPVEALLASPALAVALTVAVVSHRAEAHTFTPEELAELAGAVAQELLGGSPGISGRVYGEALLSIQGGAAYVEPGGTALNVQQLLPPQSLLLALAPGCVPSPARGERVAVAREALAAAVREGADVGAGGDDGIAALFAVAPGILTDEQTAMAYGLLRVRQDVDEFLEHLGEPYVDNDRLAEICDEESAILTDYFGFPTEAYAEIRAQAVEIGALGTKLTWALGGQPIAVIMAPGAREHVGDELAKQFAGARFLRIDMDPTGLMPGEAEEPEDSPGS